MSRPPTVYATQPSSASSTVDEERGLIRINKTREEEEEEKRGVRDFFFCILLNFTTC